MAEQVLIRNLPEELQDWIESERRERRMSLREFLVNTLRSYKESNRPLGLFDQVKINVEPVAGGVPFSFVDLFAGIGGFRLGLSRNGGTCLFTCEWDRNSQKTYRAWYGDLPHGDIRGIKPANIPGHDILAAGFPCQPFSIAGVSKKNSLGRAHGFKDQTQGTLFYNIAAIVDVKRPPVVMLENVKNLLSHDKGRTWQVIAGAMKDLNYEVFHKVIDAACYVPQHRERVIIVCFDKKVFGEKPPFQWPEPPAGPLPKLKDILEPNPPVKYTLTDHLWKYLQNYARIHREKGNGFGFGMANLDGVTRTLSARYYKDGSEVLIPQPGRNPRRLTPRECARLMGFPDDLPIVVSDTQAYRQFGNSLVPAVAEAVARQVVKVLAWRIRETGNKCLLKGHRLAMAG